MERLEKITLTISDDESGESREEVLDFTNSETSGTNIDIKNKLGKITVAYSHIDSGIKNNKTGGDNNRMVVASKVKLQKLHARDDANEQQLEQKQSKPLDDEVAEKNRVAQNVIDTMAKLADRYKQITDDIKAIEI